MGFNINTFTHILEEEVAEKLQEHGAGGSTFLTGGFKFELMMPSLMLLY